MKKLVLQMKANKRNNLDRKDYLKIERDFHDIHSKGLDWDKPLNSFFSYEDDGVDSRLIEKYFGRQLGSVENKKVLDIGSGFGNAALNLSKRGAFVTSIDISPELIKGCCYRANKNGLSVNFELMDACKLKFEDNYFDIILGFRTIHHLQNIEEFYNEAFRCLKPGGFVLLVEPQKFNPFVEIGRKFIKNDERGRTPTEHPLVPRDIKTLKEIFGNLEKHEFIFLGAASRIFKLFKITPRI
jgi:2-polyprenyl-3-methyl-5-hydroxy-6-metoxy-1,4-benzoquinol methylase